MCDPSDDQVVHNKDFLYQHSSYSMVYTLHNLMVATLTSIQDMFRKQLWGHYL